MNGPRELPLSERPELEDVLNEYVSENEKPSTKAARRWMAHYPYYRQQIAEFTASWVCMELFDAENTIRSLDADGIVLLYTSKVDELLREAMA